MTTFYIVRDPRSEIVMVAPLAIIQLFYKLQPIALERLQKETENYGTCEMHFQSGSAQLRSGSPITVKRFLGSLS